MLRFPARAGNSSLHHRVQNGSGAHPASYPMGNGGSFPGVKRPESEADQSHPSSAEVKNAWSYNSTPQYVFMAWCLVKHRGNFNFTSHFCTLQRCYSHITAVHGKALITCQLYDTRHEKMKCNVCVYVFL
jgi:hypothetical protein